MKKSLILFVLLFLFIVQGNAQIKNEQTTNSEELPSIKPVNKDVTNGISEITEDLFGRNLTLSGYVRGGGSGNSLKINTGNGYVDIGPMNTGWTHIYTDRPNFIFNKSVFSITGSFCSYNTSNLYLKTHSTTRMTILKSNGNVGMGTTNPLANLHIYKVLDPSLFLKTLLTSFILL